MNDMTCVDCGLELIQGYMIHESCFEGMLNKNSQQAEQIGVLSASLELALNQQKIDKAENQRLKEQVKLLKSQQFEVPHIE